MGDKSLGFVSNSLQTAQSNPNILPASFDLDSYERDYQLAMQLSDIHARLGQLNTGQRAYAIHARVTFILRRAIATG